MLQDPVLDDREPEPGATLGPRAAGIDPIEALEDPRQVHRGNAHPRVLDRDSHQVPDPHRAHHHAPIGLVVLDRIVDQVGEDLLERHRIGENHRQAGLDVARERHPALPRRGRVELQRPFHFRFDVARHELELELGAVELGESEEVVHQVR
jgi:hypothetical protein